MVADVCVVWFTDLDRGFLELPTKKSKHEVAGMP